MAGLAVLLKAQGKCTTDHISAAGPWLRFRGHIENISDNMFIGAVNALVDGQVGKGRNVLTHQVGESLPAIARAYKAAGQGWVAFGDENYGEGVQPRARGHEPAAPGGPAPSSSAASPASTRPTLKKQGPAAPDL